MTETLYITSIYNFTRFYSARVRGNCSDYCLIYGSIVIETIKCVNADVNIRDRSFALCRAYKDDRISRRNT